MSYWLLNSLTSLTICIFSGSQPLLVPRASLRLWSEPAVRVRRQEGARPLQRRDGVELLRPPRHGQG